MVLRFLSHRGADDLYREWAPFYPPVAHNALMRVEEAAMVALLPDVQGRVVLDAGSGTGRYARIAAARGASCVLCVDRSTSMLRGIDPTACRVRADVRALPLPDRSMDAVISGLAVMDVPDLLPAAREWSRVLRPGGTVLCSTLHPRGAALGWRRTFQTPRRTRALPTVWHTLEHFRRAYAAAGLEIDVASEPVLDSAEQPVALVVRAHHRR